MRPALRRDAVDIFMAGVGAVEPGVAVRAHLALDGNVLQAGDARIPLHPEGEVLVVGGGKAGAPMAAAVEEILGGRVARGLVAVKYGHAAPTKRVRVVEAGHPIPDEAGLDAAAGTAALVQGAGEKDLVLCLLSGGGSALLPSPVPPLTLADKQAVTDLLLAAGADIGRVNCVRKHLSALKGGGLARLAYPARVLTLILSDVVGDPLDVIASGPTVPDPTTYAQALQVLEDFGLEKRTPARVLEHLRLGAKGMSPETPKSGDPEMERAVNVIVGSNTKALEAARAEAESKGYNTVVISSTVTGDTDEAARDHALLAHRAALEGSPVPPPACLLSGGETTVVVEGSGRGGRNQQFALAAAVEMEGLPDAVILSGGTDGTDGPTDAAGAVADGATVPRARALGMDPVDYLARNDSYTFFERLGDLLVTGPTRTNVMDLHVVLVGKAGKGAGFRRRPR